MSAVPLPVQQIPITGGTQGNGAAGYVNLPWYQYFQSLANAIGPSATALEDAQLLAVWPEDL